MSNIISHRPETSQDLQTKRVQIISVVSPKLFPTNRLYGKHYRISLARDYYGLLNMSPLRLIPNKDRPTKGDRDSGCPRGQQLMCNGAQNHTLATALFVENALQLLLQSKPLHQHGKLLWLLLTMQARTVVMPLGPA